MSDIEEIKQRASLDLKGQGANDFETPQYITAHKDRVLLLKKISQLESDLKEAIDALEFYGDMRSWRDRSERTCGDLEDSICELDHELRRVNQWQEGIYIGGKRAREVLKKLKRGKE